MAVALDVSMTTGNSADGFNQQASGVTSITSTGINVSGGAGGLVGMSTWVVNVGSPTMTWNGTSMTAGPVINSTNVKSAMWVIPNPASGSNNLVCSWTTAADCYMSAASFNGCDTSTVINAADNTTATQTTTITVPSDTNGATVANFAVDGGTPIVNFNKIWAEAPLGPGGGGSYQLGGSPSNAHTFTGAGGTLQALVGVHVIASSSVFQSRLPLLGAG